MCHETIGTLQCKDGTVLCVVSSFGHTIRHFGCELVKCVIEGKVSGKRRRHTLATSQNGCLKAWNKSRGSHGITLDGEDWCNVRHGWLIITADGTAKEEV